MNMILKALGFFQLGLSLACFVVWIVLRYPLALAKQASE